MGKKILKPAFILFLLVIAIITGMVFHQYHIFPSPHVDKLLTTLEQKKEAEIPADFLETPAPYLETDVNALISIHTLQDVSRLREKLITFIWGNQGLPTDLPSFVVEKHTDDRYNNIASLQSIDKLLISMEFGLDSYAYLFHPVTPNAKMVLFHQGHRGDFFKSKKQIAKFLDNGYTVIAFSMPLLGMNNQPTVQLPRFGKFKLTSHDHIKLLQPENGHPVKFFIEPIIIVNNYLEKELNSSDIAMAGISGGGWTTTLSAAVDTRIKKSFPVAGSYPLYLRSESQRDWGDYEQSIADLYRTANYLELYMLGASGQARSQLQIINQFDACCFAGIKWETYKDIVVTRVRNLDSGEFDLFMDDSHQQHMISDIAMKQIIQHLGKSR